MLQDCCFLHFVDSSFLTPHSFYRWIPFLAWHAYIFPHQSSRVLPDLFLTWSQQDPWSLHHLRADILASCQRNLFVRFQLFLVVQPQAKHRSDLVLFQPKTSSFYLFPVYLKFICNPVRFHSFLFLIYHLRLAKLIDVTNHDIFIHALPLFDFLYNLVWLFLLLQNFLFIF